MACEWRGTAAGTACLRACVLKQKLHEHGFVDITREQKIAFVDAHWNGAAYACCGCGKPMKHRDGLDAEELKLKYWKSLCDHKRPRTDRPGSGCKEFVAAVAAAQQRNVRARRDGGPPMVRMLASEFNRLVLLDKPIYMPHAAVDFIVAGHGGSVFVDEYGREIRVKPHAVGGEDDDTPNDHLRDMEEDRFYGCFGGREAYEEMKTAVEQGNAAAQAAVDAATRAATRASGALATQTAAPTATAASATQAAPAYAATQWGGLDGVAGLPTLATGGAVGDRDTRSRSHSSDGSSVGSLDHDVVRDFLDSVDWTL